MRFVFHRKSLIIVPECYWAGEEADLLVVTDSLRLIDLEIKISRADLKADTKKSKWWMTYWPWDRRDQHHCIPEPRRWPCRIWKHYYCMPAKIWKPDLAEILPVASGVILVDGDPLSPRASIERRSKPNRSAEKISSENCIDIARLAGLRMWEARRLAEDIRAGRA